ncbi:unnamed protein product, partial [Tetraodon nigroviridis]
ENCNNKWYYTRAQIDNNPSRRAGLDPDKELSYRQQAANLLQDMGQRLNVSQLTINTAIVYMHRFYMVQSFTRFHRNVISPAALFLAAKVEEQPRKLEHVIKVAHACLNPQEPSPDIRSDAYLQQAQDLVILESIILQTLAFEITIDHPHTHVVKCTQLVRASKDLAQTSYFMATNSLHLTTFCLQYSPPVVACVCIHLACKWSNWEIPVSTDGKHWWEYVDPTVTLELLDELTHEFLQILEKTPSRLKRIRNWKAGGQTPKAKPKLQEDGDQRDTMMSMISMASSESTVAGLMSLSVPSSASLLGDKDQSASGSAQTWTGKGVPEQTNSEVHTPAKVSLSEYRAKNADVLAAQKRKLENMEASVKRDYANAAQALIGQQQRKEKQQHHQQPASAYSDLSSPSPIILKIPLEKEKHERSALKMRFPVAGGGGSSGHSARSQALGHTSDLLPLQGLPHHQGGYSHSKGEKLDTNGHGGGGSSQSNEYQDTFEMLNSLLSAQGVQPAQPSVFDYRTQYGDYRYGGGGRAGNSRPPPLPSEPPPPLPPLPK